ncbi:MAG: response regulator [Thermoanaerobaculia bacterium]
MTSVVIADDHEVVRQGVRALLRSDPSLRIVAEAADGAEAVRMVEKHRPDVLIADVAMPVMNGIEVAREVARVSPRTRTIILSMHASEVYVVDALRSGAAGYVLKDSRSNELLEAIHHVLAGRRYLSPPLSQRAIDAYLEKIESSGIDLYETLTPREQQIFRLAAEGQTNHDIAAQLFISSRTVETHRANVMKKLGLRTHTELVLFAVRRGLLKVDESP